MGEKYGFPSGLAMIVFMMASDYNNATPEEQDEIFEDAIEFAERKKAEA